MEAGSLKRVITLQEAIQTSDGMGNFTTTWVDWTNHDEWEADTEYALGDLRQPTTHNNFYYKATRAGTSGATEPTWPTTEDATIDDPDGDGVEWEAHVPKIRAAIWPLKSTERMEAMQNQLTVTHRIRIRYLSGVLPSFRIKYGSRYFAIRSMINLREESREIEFLAEENIGG